MVVGLRVCSGCVYYTYLYDIRWAVATYQCVLDVARVDARQDMTCGDDAQGILVFLVNQTMPGQIRNMIGQHDIYVELTDEVS